MPTDVQRIQETLYRSHLFADLEDDELDRLAQELKLIFPVNGTRVIEQGDHADRFYIVYRGTVNLLWNNGTEEISMGLLENGDYFGEEGLIGRKPYDVTAVVGTTTVLIEFTADQVKHLTKKHPAVRNTLRMVARTQELVQKLNFNWLGEKETIYLIARRHWFILFLRLLLPVTFWLIALLFALWAWVSTLSLPWMLAGVCFAIGLVWGLWNYLDWTNDYYILTDERIVWLEQVIGLYENRQEAPLYTIRSTDLQSSQVGRILNYGNVIVKTFTSMITLDNVSDPQHITDLINEHRERAQEIQRSVAHEAIHETVRQHIGIDRRPKPPLPKRRWRKKRVEKVRGPAFWRDFIRMRYEQGDTITYRKHWIILIWQTWLPAVLTLGVVVLMFLQIINWMVTLVLLLIPVIWWIYEYADWRNDIFQVTYEKIFDIDKKPLGTEQRREASLDNILSLVVKRVGIFGILFNFGDVIIDVSGTQFVFDHIFNPALAQQDIFRRIDVLKRKKQEEQDKNERERLAEWIEVYDDESNNPYNWRDIGY
jgi:hypothetical protein